MALQKQAIDINFGQGLDTKTDPKRVQIGKFLELNNTVFQKSGMLQKRNGYEQLPSLPDTSSTFLTTFNDSLTAIGTNLTAYSSGQMQWIEKGNLQPLSLNTLPLIRSATNQSQTDSVISPGGLICTVYTDQNPADLSQPIYKYAVADVSTGQNVVPPTVIVPTSGTVSGGPKVFMFGNRFVVVFPVLITAAYHLQFIAMPLVNPQNATAAANITSQYSQSTERAWEGVVANNALYLAWDGSDLGGAIRITYIDQGLTVHSVVVYSTFSAEIVSVTADTTQNSANIYVSFYDSSLPHGYTLVVNPFLSPALAPTSITVEPNLINITSSAQNNLCTVFFEKDNFVTALGVNSNYVFQVTITNLGVVTSAVVNVRSVGIASKSFLVSGVIYFLAAYDSPFQPSYFLVNSASTSASPQPIAKLAYTNGGGYLTHGLPYVNVSGQTASVSYLIKDLITSVNKNTNVPSGTQVGGIYSQTGINLVTFTLGTEKFDALELANNLHFGGGFLWMYDGYFPVEQNFLVYPDVDTSGVATQADPVHTGDTTISTNVLTNLSSVAGLAVGMLISGTGITAGTYIVSFTATTVTMSANATASNAGVTFTFTGGQGNQVLFYQVTYEWADNQGNVFRSAPSVPTKVTTTAGNSSVVLNVPTLRLTYKIPNPAKIVIYRWSTAQESYYQVTSTLMPILNDTTIDYITYIDGQSDDLILGNNLIYTTGGVIEDLGPPATDLMTIFDTRLWLVDSEDRNLLWYSKQVIEATPVEMSDLFTKYIDPTIGGQGSTGPITAVSVLDDKFIAFKKNAISYFSGAGPDNTGASSQYTEPFLITSTVGCTNQNSICFMPMGLMFQSDKGIWLLGRDLSTKYIGAPVEQFNSANVLSALVIPATNEVRFTLDNGITLMYDYFQDQWGSFKNVPAVSATIFQNLHTFINSRGEVFQESPGLYLDGTSPVLMSFRTSWFSLAGFQGYQRAYLFNLLGTYLSPHKLFIQVAYDFNPNPSQQTLITPNNYNPLWGQDTDWGNISPWGGNPNGEQWTVTLQKQTCQSIQILFNEVYDSTLGLPAGGGLTLSGISLLAGFKRANFPIKQVNIA